MIPTWIKLAAMQNSGEVALGCIALFAIGLGVGAYFFLFH